MCADVYTLELTLNRSAGVFQIGDTIKIFPEARVNARLISSGQLSWTIIKNFDKPVAEGTLELGVPGACITMTADEPCFYQCKVTYSPEDADDITAMVGVGIEPEKIKQNWDIPADFDTFWDKQKARLVDIPLKADITPLKAEGMKAYDVKITCVDNQPVSGILLTPEETGNNTYPAIISLQGAGVRSARINNYFVENNFITLDINAHGLDNLMDPNQYAEIFEQKLEGYPQRGFLDDSPAQIYFINMFLRVKRAVEFMASRPEWDGKNLYLIGSSQGGLQSFAGAYLDERVSGIAVNVPAGSNIAQGGWPFCGNGMANLNDAERCKLRKNAPYVDNVSFASKLTIPATMIVGFIDETCRPSGVYAVYNAYKGPKTMFDAPKLAHAVDPWLWNKCINTLISIEDKQG